jgi:hypothetical protein
MEETARDREDAPAAGKHTPEQTDTGVDRERTTTDDRTPDGGQLPPRSAVMVLLVALAVAAAVAISYSLLRIAGEQHYQSCVAAAVGNAGGATDPLTRLVRKSAISRCTRSPF